MSSIKDNKQKVFGKIAAVKALNQSPNIKQINSLSSINNSGNEIDFLLDLFKITGTYNELISVINKILIDELSNIELAIKNELKNNIKSNLSCTIDPKIPLSIINTGFNTEVKNIDYYNILFIDPESENGNLIYNEPFNLTSKDFNTFLYYVIQSGNEQTWSDSFLNRNLLNVRFYESGLNVNNSFNFKINSEYTNKRISVFNNNFIDSIKLFETKDIISKVFNNITGNISSNTNKTSEQLNAEQQINDIIQKILNSDTDVIDDSYFMFSNDELSRQELDSFKKSQGIVTLNQETEINTNVNQSVFVSSLTSINNELNSNTSTYNNKSDSINNAIDNISNDLSNDVNPSNKQSVKVNLIENIIKNLSLVLSTTIISPKVILLYQINSILLGETPPNNAIDFMKSHKYLISGVAKSVKDKIVQIMVKKITKIIINLVNSEIKSLVKEQINNKLLTLKSLIPLT